MHPSSPGFFLPSFPEGSSPLQFSAPTPSPANPLDEIFQIPRNYLQNKNPLVGDLLKKTAYPAIMAGAVGATYAGISLGIPNLATFAYVSSAAIMASTATEYLIPYRKDWMPESKELQLDFLHNALTTGAIPEVFKFFTYGAIYYAGTELAALHSMESFWAGWGLNAWPLAAQAALIVGVGSFGDYWKHRILHKSKTLWPIHETHHTSEKLTTLHAARSHVLDILGTYSMFLSLGLVGMPEEALLLSSSFIGTHVMLQHSNADLDLGKLALLMPGPRNHRWHHSTIRKESNTNFGNFLAIWDHIFGTFYLPSDRVGPEKLGLGRSFIDPEKSALENWWEQMRRPFQIWGRSSSN